MYPWQEKRLYELACKISDDYGQITGYEFTSKEKKEWEELNIIWEKEQNRREFESWKANQPI